METIYNFNLTLNHNLGISLMYDAEQKFNKYFVFLSLAPGISGSDGSRSFDFKNNIALKLTPIKIAELGHNLVAYAKGQEKLMGSFMLYVDSSKSAHETSAKNKSVSLQRFVDEKGKVTINLSFKTDSMPKGMGASMGPGLALALADVCQMIYMKALDLEMNAGAVSYTKSEGSKKAYTPKAASPSVPKASPPVEQTMDDGDPF
jgi:hypothetical protein